MRRQRSTTQTQSPRQSAPIANHLALEPFILPINESRVQLFPKSTKSQTYFFFLHHFLFVPSIPSETCSKAGDFVSFVLES